MSATTTPAVNPTSVAWSEYVDSQTFNVTGVDGSPMPLTVDEITSFVKSLTRQQAVYGFSLGFCAMLTIVLLLLGDSKKLRRPIYVLNLVTLVLFTFRVILELVISTTIGADFGVNFIGGTAQLGSSDLVCQFIAYTIQPFWYAAIIASLVLQVRVVFAAEPTAQKIVTGVLSISGLAFVGLESYLCIMAIIGDASDPTADHPMLDKLIPILEEYFVTYVGVSCIVFLYKLAVTILLRRKMGIKRFGPLQIIFIMFSQCLVVPLVFYILDLTNASQVVNFNALGQVFLVCTLPLSALWASADAEGRRNRPEVPSFANFTATDSDKSHHGKFSFFSKAKKSSQDSYSSYSTDLEKAPDYPHDGVQIHSTSHVVGGQNGVTRGED